jgi:hypothetical protein
VLANIVEPWQKSTVHVTSQGSAAEAKKSIDKAKYLSIEATSLLRPFLKTQGMSEETRWRLLRPVMRLLLWLIPEHLPTPWTVSAAAVTVQPAGQGTAAGRQNTAATEADEGWRQVTAITFACEVTTVSLLLLGTTDKRFDDSHVQPVLICL